MSPLSHIDAQGKAQMVDIGDKVNSKREACADGHIAMAKQTRHAIENNGIAKGDVLATARIAAIMAAKRTSDLIPLCHPLALTNVTVEFGWTDDDLRVEVLVGTSGKTGVEMEALTAASVALLTIYDMAKSMQKDMVIGPVRLLKKTGGKSGDWQI